ncbi:MAG: hypothetical protein LLF80_02590 [Porphyromonadaceae bacterium]|nr:hypothetical protein [Porphyromonadaceae bacterium]
MIVILIHRFIHRSDRLAAPDFVHMILVQIDFSTTRFKNTAGKDTKGPFYIFA